MLAKLPKPDPASVVEEAQPTINPLNTQAMAAASKQANEYFDAARQGKYLQQPTAFPPEVLSGLLAQAMLNQRFMLSFDRGGFSPRFERTGWYGLWCYFGRQRSISLRSAARPAASTFAHCDAVRRIERCSSFSPGNFNGLPICFLGCSIHGLSVMQKELANLIVL